MISWYCQAFGLVSLIQLQTEFGVGAQESCLLVIGWLVGFTVSERLCWIGMKQLLMYGCHAPYVLFMWLGSLRYLLLDMNLCVCARARTCRHAYVLWSI